MMEQVEIAKQVDNQIEKTETRASKLIQALLVKTFNSD